LLSAAPAAAESTGRNSKKQLPLAIMTNCCTAGLSEVSQGPGSTSCLLMAVGQQKHMHQGNSGSGSQ
jgi:hypothetical protein